MFLVVRLEPKARRLRGGTGRPRPRPRPRARARARARARESGQEF
jgi:hypothetical protein